MSKLDKIDLTLVFNRLLTILFVVETDLVLQDVKLLVGEVFYDFIIGLALHLITR